MNDDITDKFFYIYFVLFCFFIVSIFVWIFTVVSIFQKIDALEVLHSKEYCLECGFIVDKNSEGS